MNNASAGNIGSWQAALAIARRDLLEFVRDRRTLFITLLLPMVTYPIVALWAYGLLWSTLKRGKRPPS